MAHSDKPKVPPIQQHRSAGDTGVPQRDGDVDNDSSRVEDRARDAGQDNVADDPRRADEEGAPGESGRSHGRVIDEFGEPAGGQQKGQPSENEDWESGRHNAQ